MDQGKDTQDVVLEFLRRVVDNRELRTEYMLKLAPLAAKVIPVISTYFEKDNLPGSIGIQEKTLRVKFQKLAFRTSFRTLKNDLTAVAGCAKPQDYFFVDLEDIPVDLFDAEIILVKDLLKSFTACPIILLRSALSKNITNSGLDHGEVVPKVDNELMNHYKSIGGNSFADYSGIKKDDVTDGGGISPGFIFYDATQNQYYGFRTTEKKKKLEHFLEIIIPKVLNSDATRRMHASPLPFLSMDNKGWDIINKMESGTEKSKSAAKFKRISMEHYLHCIKTRIDGGELI